MSATDRTAGPYCGLCRVDGWHGPERSTHADANAVTHMHREPGGHHIAVADPVAER